MSIEVARDAIQWGFSKFEEQQVKIMLWGGEPLKNLETLMFLLDTYPQVRFTVVTNGYLIDEPLKKQLATYHNLYISLSVANAKDTYPDYMKKLEHAIDLVRITKGDVHYVSKDAANMYSDYEALTKLGVPMVRMSVPRDVDISDTDLARIESEWKRIGDLVFFTGNFKEGFGKTNFDRGFQSNLVASAKGTILSNQQPYFCGCGYQYMSIDTNGDVYPCDWFCGLQKYKFGDIYGGLDEAPVTMFKEWHDKKDEYYKGCGSCEVGTTRLCSRAMCLAENLEKTGDVWTPQKSHCRANLLEHRVHKYLVDKAQGLGLLC